MNEIGETVPVGLNPSPSPEQVAELVRSLGGLDKLAGEIGSLREVEQGRFEANQRAKKAMKIAIIVATVVGFIGIVIGGIGIAAGHSASQNADELRSQRTAGRIIFCQEANASADRQHVLWRGILGLGTKEPDPGVLDAFYKILDDTYQTRDCSPTAVDQYYSR